MVLQKSSGPAVRGMLDQILSAGYCALEFWQCPVLGRGLEFVGTLPNIDYILRGVSTRLLQ